MFDVFVSVIVYSLTGFTMLLLAYNMANNDARSLKMRGVNSKMWSASFVVSVIVFSIIAGMRYNTGVDHLSYLESFIHGGDPEDEVGFYIITRLLHYLGFHYFFYFALWAALQITFIYLALKNRREILPFVALAIMLGPYFLEWMNGIRQTLVECFFVLIVSRFCSQKTVKSFIWSAILLLISTTFHRSALILAPLLLLCILNIKWDKKWLNIGIVVACLLIGSTPYWIGMNAEGVSQVLAILGYDHYSTTYEDMVGMADFKETAFGPLRIASLIVDLAIIWFYPKVQVYFREDKVLPAFFMFFFFGVCAYNLFANTNLLFLRPIAYFTIFKLPLIGYTLYFLKKTKNTWFYILVFLIYTYAMIDVLKSGLLGIKETNLYHFFFMQ